MKTVQHWLYLWACGTLGLFIASSISDAALSYDAKIVVWTMGIAFLALILKP